MGKAQGQIQEASARLCEEFQRVMPLHPEKNQRKKRPSAKEITAASEAGLKKFYEIALAERQRHRLGMINRARVAFGLQQRLLQAGYSPVLVKQVLFAMLTSSFIGGR